MGAKERLPRRDFLKLAGTTAVVLLATRDFALRNENLGYLEEISPDIKSELLKYSPVTIAHRGGNGVDNLNKTLGARANFAEADVRPVRGSIVVGHEQYFGPFVVDGARRSFRIGGPRLLLDEVAQYSATQDQNLFLDLKDVNLQDARRIEGIIEKRGLKGKTAYSSKNWEVLDELGGKDNLFYTIEDMDGFKKFILQQEKMKRRGVSMNQGVVVPESMEWLKDLGVKIWVYTIHNSEDGLRVLQLGADGLISNNLSLLSIYNSK